MITPDSSSAKDVRAFMIQRGREALWKAPVREWCAPSVNNDVPPQKSNRRLPCIHFDEFGPVQAKDELVAGLLSQGGTSVIFGKSNVGKSFWALDLAVHVATGRPFMGAATGQGGVIYVTLEGRAMFGNRLAALRQSGRWVSGAPFWIIAESVNLLEASDGTALIDSVLDVTAKGKAAPALVVIDTLSRAMAGGDESRSTDMTTVIRSVDEIREKTGAHVMLIHHCGKDEARGARGHTSLRAAIDTEIEISRVARNVCIAAVTKQRDLPTSASFAFSLEPCFVGYDSRRQPIHSCCVVPVALPDGQEGKSSGGEKKISLADEDVLALAAKLGSIFSKKEFAKQIRDVLHATHRDADAAIARLITSGKIIEHAKDPRSGKRGSYVQVAA